MRTIGILLIALTAACAGVKQAPPASTAQSGLLLVDPWLLGRNQDRTVAAEPPRSEAIREAAAPAPSAAPTHEPATIAIQAVKIEPAADAPAAPPKNQHAAKAAAPTAKAPAMASASAPTVEQPRKSEEPPAAVRKPQPPLDIATLKTRLRETNAIGVFTKLALKNQVDDLLQQFRAHYLSGQKTSVAALRQPYDMLILKVLALIQDSDPSLAQTISGSREAIWGILADPVKFNSLS